jgi:Mn-dependent DtxR family transcriptional regulator
VTDVAGEAGRFHEATWHRRFTGSAYNLAPTRSFRLFSAAMPKTSESAEDYLERIYELIEDKGYARMVDIARTLRIRQASVTQMVQKLGETGFVRYEKYRGLVLTTKGKGVARAVRRRHQVLEEFFALLGVDGETAQRDLEGIEHHLSAASVGRIEELVRFLRENPGVLRKIGTGRREKGT